MSAPPRRDDMKPGDIAKSVCMAIKRNGTFDAVRKRANADVSKSAGFLEDVREDGKRYCDNMFGSIIGNPPSADIEMSKSLKEFMMGKIKEHAGRKEIGNRVRWTIEKEITLGWVQNALQGKVEDMVREHLGLPPLPKPMVAEETDVEDPSSKGDYVKQEEPEEEPDQQPEEEPEEEPDEPDQEAEEEPEEEPEEEALEVPDEDRLMDSEHSSPR